MNNGISTELIAEILENIKLVLKIDDTKQDELLIYYINAICNNILIKTNRSKFPEQLKYLVVDLTKNQFDINNTNNPELKEIKSMSEYDRSVSFGISDILKSKLDLIARKQIEDNEKLINRFKLLYKS